MPLGKIGLAVLERHPDHRTLMTADEAKLARLIASARQTAGEC